VGAEVDVMLELLTESRAQVARRCLREEHLRYVVGLVVALTEEALRFGSLWHYGQEGWWKSIDRTERLDCALHAMREHATPETDAYELARAEAMMEGYDARWGDEQYEVLGVEVEFRAPLVNPETGASSRTFERAGKEDVLVRDVEGREFVMEHKSAGEDIGQGSAFWARLRMGGQAAGYIRGGEAMGYRPEGVIYDVARKPDLRPYKATPVEERKYTKEKQVKCARCCDTGGEWGGGTCVVCNGSRRVVEPSRLYANQRETDETVDEYRDRVRAAIAEDPDRYYQRGLVVRLEAQMTEADAELWQLGQTLRECHRLGLAPRNTDACQRYGRTCSYFPICAGEASADDERYVRLRFPHSELSPQFAANPKEEGIHHG
jgi:hypothetical protein